MNINFYVGKSNSLNKRLLFACKLIEKARLQNLTSYIHTDSWQTCERMDEVLWTYNDVSFIPHGIFSKTKESLPVLIGYEEESYPRADFLINISNGVPLFLPNFIKVAEILDQEAEILDAGRKRYGYYREQGYTLNYYQL